LIGIMSCRLIFWLTCVMARKKISGEGFSNPSSSLTTIVSNDEGKSRSRNTARRRESALLTTAVMMFISARHRIQGIASSNALYPSLVLKRAIRRDTISGKDSPRTLGSAPAPRAVLLTTSDHHVREPLLYTGCSDSRELNA